MEITNDTIKEITDDPVMKDMIGTIKYLTTIAYKKGFREGEKANRLRMANLLNKISEEMKKDLEPTKTT